MMVTRRRSLPRGSVRRSIGFGMVLGVLMASSACQMGARGGGSATPGGNGAVSEGPDPEGPNEGDNIGDLKARLDRLRTEQAQMMSSSDGSFGVCEDLCSLASKICTVKEKLCEIADRHAGEDEYQGLCRKAVLECNEAEDSCVDCVEARESSEASEAAASSP